MSSEDYNAFVAAAYRGDESYILTTLGRVPIDCEDENGDTALISATLAGQKHIVEFLLQNKADVNHENRFGFTPLLWASEGNSLELVQMLVQSRANVNHKESDGYSALALAAKAGALPVVKFLATVGVDVDSVSKRLDSPLLLATSRGKVDVVEFLIGVKCNVNMVNKEGATPLLMAAWSGSVPTAKYLVDAKADINFRNTQRGDTALILAAYRGFSDLVEWLVSAGARDDYVNSKGTGVYSFKKLDIEEAVKRGKEKYALKFKKAEVVPKDPTAVKDKIHVLKEPATSPVVAAEKKAGMSEIEAFMEEEFAKIVGMDGVKDQLRAFYKKVQLDKIREKQLGKKVEKNRLFHMIFMGPPGTGKTTMAKLAAKVMLKMGLLKTENVIMVNNPLDLIAGYVGQTPGKVDAKVKEAEGGVLFIDEAYSIVKKEGKDQFGREAIDTIMKHMDPPACVFILAGYERQMNEFLDVNEGLSRRIPYRYHFHPYSPAQLGDILRMICKDRDEDLEAGSVDACVKLLQTHLTMQQRESQNAGLVSNWISFAQVERDDRISIEDAKKYPDLASLLLLCDFEAAIPALKNMAQK